MQITDYTALAKLFIHAKSNKRASFHGRDTGTKYIILPQVNCNVILSTLIIAWDGTGDATIIYLKFKVKKV